MKGLVAAFSLGCACLAAHAVEPGELVPDVSAPRVTGGSATLRSLARGHGAVVITRDVDCPVSQRYMPRIAEMAKRYREAGLRFVLLDVTPHDRAAAKSSAKAVESIETLADEKKSVATALGAESTAEAFLIDRAGTLQYRGAIDDQYGISFQRDRAATPWLARAITHVRQGELPFERRTRAHGCPLDLKPARMDSQITYHNRVSRIIQAKCQVCHRVNGLGPMPLETYDQVHGRLAVIQLMVSSGRMPPWSADPHVGEWANDRSLSRAEKEDLLAWVNAGGPEGDKREAPLPRKFPDGWNIGKPDAIVPIPKPIRVPAQGTIEYQQVFVKTDFPTDKWITAVEIRPTQPRVVHHVLAFLEEPNSRQPKDGALGFFAATVPGSLGMTYPAGTGKLLPKGAWMRLEIHYQPNGTQLMDRTRIGFRFSPTPLREVHSLAAPNSTFVIPPGNPHYEVRGAYRFANAGQILTLFPHMHLRGAAFRYELKFPDGKVERLLEVPRFDFNWQSEYQLASPLEVPAGAELIATAWYDNSKSNPWNPDPTKAVRWGPQTYEEMMIGYFDFIAAGQKKRAPL
jgi:peroxiredoxin